MKDNYYSLKNSRRRKKSRTRRKMYSSHKNYSSESRSSYAKMQSNYRKRQARKLNYKKVFICLAIFCLILYMLISGIVKLFSHGKNSSEITTSTEPHKDISVNMAVVGDVMCHTTNFNDAYDKQTDTYDFTKVFTDIANYIQSADIAVGNLETTFAGKDVGYSGYPTFNTPEQLAQNLKDLGLDVLSTANNHSLDKHYNGLVSTLDELDKVGLSHTGTYRSEDEQNTILIKQLIN